VVIYTDEGFSPVTLTIKAGETVMFESQGSRTMWVASDPHPTHTDDRDFDARRGFGPGEVYSYTFTEVGTWGYHNHLSPGLRGTIVVTSE
jgi:plastocyanin